MRSKISDDSVCKKVGIQQGILVDRIVELDLQQYDLHHMEVLVHQDVFHITLLEFHRYHQDVFQNALLEFRICDHPAYIQNRNVDVHHSDRSSSQMAWIK